MAGYADDFSMSNNAIDAYDRGLRPRSKWSKADILYVARQRGVNMPEMVVEKALPGQRGLLVRTNLTK